VNKRCAVTEAIVVWIEIDLLERDILLNKCLIHNSFPVISGELLALGVSELEFFDIAICISVYLRTLMSSVRHGCVLALERNLRVTTGSAGVVDADASTTVKKEEWRRRLGGTAVTPDAEDGPRSLT
jgi:hypothetical protein